MKKCLPIISMDFQIRRIYIKTDKGLTKEIVKTISERKEEPQWMLEYRLNALKEFYRMPMPTWGWRFI